MHRIHPRGAGLSTARQTASLGPSFGAAGLTARANTYKLAVDGDQLNIVVLRANDCEFGLLVDQVNDTEEIVVKPLSRQLKGLSEYAGATIMGDGAVALILDVMGLASGTGLVAETREHNRLTAQKADGTSASQVATFLVADIGDTRRFALPTSMISRLETFPQSAIEYAGGREVLQYRGAIMPVIRLSAVFGAAQHDDAAQQDLQIVVCDDQDHRCGLVVSRIVDIVETELQPCTSSSADDILLGTSVIQERVTDVLNLRSLARRPAALVFQQY